jgi:hypothetical protein
MKYLQESKGLYPTLEAESIGNITSWIVVSYAVHPDVFGHAGGVMIICKVGVSAVLTSQKLKTRSPTE